MLLLLLELSFSKIRNMVRDTKYFRIAWEVLQGIIFFSFIVLLKSCKSFTYNFPSFYRDYYFGWAELFVLTIVKILYLCNIYFVFYECYTQIKLFYSQNKSWFSCNGTLGNKITRFTVRIFNKFSLLLYKRSFTR